jgi:flagellar protein FliS
VNPYAAQSEAYRQSAVMTASPEQLVVMLYDGAIRFLRQAEAAYLEGSYLPAGERMTRAEAIIDELLCTLNPDAGEVVERLEAIYIFCKRCLVDARIGKDAVPVGHVIRLFGELREAWATIAAGAVTPVPA